GGSVLQRRVRLLPDVLSDVAVLRAEGRKGCVPPVLRAVAAGHSVCVCAWATGGGKWGVSRVVHLCRPRDPYGEFPNFAPYPVEIDGKRWSTSEHKFQAQKFAGTPHEEAIRQTPSPMIAARVGRSPEQPIRADWEAVKDNVTRRAVRAKFR